MKVAVFHPGTQHSWQTAAALQQLGRLQWFATSIFYDPSRWPYRLDRLPAPIGPRLGREFRRFQTAGIDPSIVRTTGVDEWLERIASRAGLPRIARWLDRRGNEKFGRALRHELASPDPFALWGFDGSSVAAFEAAKARDRVCILDRTIGHRSAYNRIMAGVRSEWPEWFDATSDAIPAHQIALEEREFELADIIVTGSASAATTVIEESRAANIAEKVKVLPYCFDPLLFPRRGTPDPVPRDQPVRFLMVGQITPRKGAHLLLEAISAIPARDATLTLVGGMLAPAKTFARYADRVTYLPSVSRSEIPAIMAAHHVLVFPSYFEGSALSLLEALASGLGVIQSRQAGNGATVKCGLILDENSVDAVREAMYVPIRNRDLLDHWRANALIEAENYTFDRYRDNIAALLDALPQT